ncbi:hypothetical protein QWJ34_01205 [Saccharibacillus sp. CPCC 101409]|uniref:hypothetical protein n=1 Tax=Saccharibacillus sp. CPCC 101409 TaxID=3058041 RepID=UPI0026717473|nr:hypothetical protein [Saccharibacillus sp. CPCC 101409]MDO3408378.1 hypothetical protein [Saccharibacillus sp. CPCC 101409]
MLLKDSVDVFYKLILVGAPIALLIGVLRPSITKEEILFMSFSAKVIRNIVFYLLYISGVSFYFLFFTSFSAKLRPLELESNVFLGEILSNPVFISLVVILAIYVFMLSTNSKVHKFIIKKRNNDYKNPKDIIIIMLFLFIFPLISFLMIGFTFGYLSNAVLAEAAMNQKINVENSLYVLAYFKRIPHIYYVVLGSNLFWFSLLLYMFKKYVSLFEQASVYVSIILKDGNVLKNIELLNHNMSGFLFVANSDKTIKKAIPKENIYSIEFHKQYESFGHAFYRSKIKMPSELSIEEQVEMKKEMKKIHF